MKKRLVAGLLLIIATASVHAGVIFTGAGSAAEDFNTTQVFFSGQQSADDLINGLTATVSGWNTGLGAHPDEITDGIYGAADPGSAEPDRVQGGWAVNGATAEYNLGLGTAGAGYDITSIQNFADWSSAFGNQGWTVEVKPVGGSYSLLATVAYNPLTAGGGTKVVLTGLDATGIEYIKFTATNSNSIWRELDVFGTETAPDLYLVWAGNKGLDATNDGFDVDAEGDGVVNGLEWVLGGDPLASDAPAILPAAGADSATGLTLAFTREESSIAQGALLLECEWAADLLGIWTALPIGASSSTGPNDETVTIDESTTPDSVIVTIPDSNAVNGSLFACLRATRSPESRAETRVSDIFSDHMVLQRGMAVPVWGTAEPGERVEVRFAGQVKQATANEDGRWMLRLDPMTANWDGRPMEVVGKTTVLLADVLVGEVWIASGQSNMEMPLGNKYRPEVYPGVENFEEEVLAADHPLLRLMKVDRRSVSRPLENVPTQGWQVCEPESAELFSAVGYFFGRYLVENLQVPVGIITSAQSSTTAEQWTSIDALAPLPQFAETVDFYRQTDEFQQIFGLVPNKEPSGLFNGGLAPVIPYAIRGAIWYQGESNASRAAEYRELLPTMITDWRARWGQGDFPFYLVQLAGFRTVTKDLASISAASEWPELRDAQSFAAASLPHVDLAVAIDIGMPNFIHPLNKQEVGRRLGLLASADTYGADLEYSGPRFNRMEVIGNQVVLHFDHIGGGLVSLNTEAAGTLDWFAVAGADRQWHWGEAMINGSSVVVTCPAVPEPVAVRYAWASNIECDFYNTAGLPAVPFRTDDWPLATQGEVYDPGVAFLDRWQELGPE